MRQLIFKISFIFLIATSSSVYAGELPSVLKNGFAEYKSSDPKSAITAWIKGSSIEGSMEALSQANVLRQIEDFFGPYIGYDLFKSYPLGPKADLYLISMNYEKGILFASFLTYKLADGKSIVQTFTFNTEVDKVWPTSALYAE